MAEFNELVDKLKRDEPLLLHMMEIRYKHPDYQDEDVWTALGIGSSKYYTEKKRLAELRREYIDICYWGGAGTCRKKKEYPFLRVLLFIVVPRPVGLAVRTPHL